MYFSMGIKKGLVVVRVAMLTNVFCSVFENSFNLPEQEPAVGFSVLNSYHIISNQS